MADITQEELLALARAAMMKIPEEDVEHLTLRYNALMESLEVLEQYPLDGELALPALPHPFELPSSRRPTGAPPSLTTESSDPLAYKPITELVLSQLGLGSYLRT